MTHDEACELVQGSVERALTTLLHIQKRLEKGKPFSRQDELRVKDFDVLYNINFYGAFLQGARKMYLALHDHGFLDIPCNACFQTSRERKLTNEAMIKCYMDSTRNMEWLLNGMPQGIEMYTAYERDKNGKVKSAKSEFRKEVVKYERV